MARKKKNDFWDDVDDIEVKIDSRDGNPAAKRAVDEEWSAIKSLPLKVIMRVILMIACLVALGSAYIAYQYVGDRYAGGSYSTDFYDSGSFAAEYNKSMDQLMKLVQAMEADPSVTQSGNEEMLATLVENYMGKDTNFTFLIQDSDHFQIVSGGEDAKERITSSHHYVELSNIDGETTTKSSIAASLLNKDEWQSVLSETSNTYIIYSAVDDTLTQTDAYYKANQRFDKMQEYFNIARFVGIIAAVIFVIALIFCIMSTGMKRGYDTVCLTWFDKIFTEIALAIMIAVGGGLIYAIQKLQTMNGDMYRYAALALVVVTYAWVIRSYFSIVRRIKAGRLLRGSLIGTVIRAVAGAIGKLPSPLNVIVGGLILIAINGGLIYALIFMRQYTVRDIPVIFIVAPVVFVIELLALLLRGGHDSELSVEGAAADASEQISDLKLSSDAESAGEPERAEAVEEPSDSAAAVDEAVYEEEHQDWETMDLGKAIEEAERDHAQQQSAPEELTYIANPEVVRPTEVLSVEAVEKAIRASGLTPKIPTETPAVESKVTSDTIVAADSGEAVKEEAAEDVVKEETVIHKILVPDEEDDGRVNFVQLNKDVRKEFKAQLKAKGISVTVRAPEKPVIIDIDRNSLHMIIEDIFKQVLNFASSDVRTYVEVYLQNGKVVYIVKIPVAAELQQEVMDVLAGEEAFDAARKIVEANDGKFVATLDGNTLKAGMMIDAADAE